MQEKKDREFEECKEHMRIQREQDEKKKAAQEAELDAAKEEVEQGNLERFGCRGVWLRWNSRKQSQRNGRGN